MTTPPPRVSSRRVTSQQIAAAGWPPLSRAKDINAHPYFRGAISRWAWRFYTYRLTPASRWFFTLSVLFISLGYSSLDLQIYVPFTYAFGIWVVAIAGAALFKPRVALTVRHAHRIRADAILPIDIDIQQRRFMLGAPMTLIPHCLPPALDAVPEEGTPIPALARGEKTHLRTGVSCTRRGLHRWKGFRVECDFPFGLIRAYRTYSLPQDVLVFPTFTRLARLQIPVSLRYQPGGVVFASTLAESLEYIGNREYREGDNIRDIDWRATARLNLPIVREYREEYFLRVGVILDTHLPERIADDGRMPPLRVKEQHQRVRTLKIKEQQAQAENFERAVSLAAAVSDYMARSDYIVDLFAAGPNLFHLTAGRSLAYLDQILDILACVEGSASEPFDVLEPEILSSLAQITTIVCVFMDWNPARQAFVGRLQREGAGIKVIVVRDRPCTLDPRDADMPGGITVISKADFLSGIEEI